MTLHLSRLIPVGRLLQRKHLAQWHHCARIRRSNKHNARATYYIVNGRALRWYQVGI